MNRMSTEGSNVPTYDKNSQFAKNRMIRLRDHTIKEALNRHNEYKHLKSQYLDKILSTKSPKKN